MPKQSYDILFSERTTTLFLNTGLLCVSVTALSALLAFPSAWLATYSKGLKKTIANIIGIMPIALPGYLMAYGWQSFVSSQGFAQKVLGISLPSVDGFWGALFVLSLYCSSYFFLHIKNALLKLDISQFEGARSLGLAPRKAFIKSILPQLYPSLFSASFIVSLHVLGDFGVVGFMHYETISMSLYTLYSSGGLKESYVLGAILLVIAFVLLTLQRKLTAKWSHNKSRKKFTSSAWKPTNRVLSVYSVIFFLLSVGIPSLSIVFWFLTPPQIENPYATENLISAITNSLTVSSQTAIYGTLFLALPLAWYFKNSKSWLSKYTSTITQLNYALPPVALALTFIMLSLTFLPFIYQTQWILITALIIHFFPEAISPVQNSMQKISKNIEEASRSLGLSETKTLLKVTLPNVRNSLLFSFIFLFIATLKELPITLILAPAGFTGLAAEVWDTTNEVLYAESAPFALSLLLISIASSILLLSQERVGK